MTPAVTRKTPPSSIDDCPRSLRDGRERLVGLIDGYPNYYDRTHHRIDVLLETGDGTRRLTEYYNLQPSETVSEYVRKAEANGYDCTVLSQWTATHGSYTALSVLARIIRGMRTVSSRLLTVLSR
jgi:hypothetical protein